MIRRAKNEIKKVCAVIVYRFYRWGILKNHLRVKTIDETLDALLNTEKSIVRFGDGELAVLCGKDIFFQKTSPEIAEGLKRILSYPHEDLLVAIPDIFEDLEKYTPRSAKFWKEHLLAYRNKYYRFCNLDKEYCNSFMTRAYINFADKSQSTKWFEKFRQILRDRDLVIVEGCTTHNGVGNDLLAYAKSVERIICPSRNAYGVRDQILDACTKYGKDRLFLFSLGITAKGLVEELFLQGYRVLDIGNLDMEYEWCVNQVQTNLSLEKHQMITEEDNKKAGYDEYLKQVACRIVLSPDEM